jgi:hypothetical protein
MLPEDKSIKKISEIEKDFSTESLRTENILRSFKALKLSNCFSEFNNLKAQGFNFRMVLEWLIRMTVMPEKTVNLSLPQLKEDGARMGKDVFYRFKNDEKICWRWILWHVVLCFLRLVSTEKKSSGRKYCYLSFDDSVLPKTGKKIEKIGKVWDHVEQCSVLGFKLLVAFYYDGTSPIPVDFSIHREKGKKAEKPCGMTAKELRHQKNKKRAKGSENTKRVKELDESKITMMLQMFWSAFFRGLPIDYVLVDSWFYCEALIQSVQSAGVHLIGMYKFVATKFDFRGKKLNYNEIRNLLGAPKRCKKCGFYYLRADVMLNGIPLTLYFSRQGRRGKWKVLLTTDKTLSFIQLIEHYQNRWMIEVFFKEAKQLLGLGACQSSTFDAQIADTTIVMLAYILLAFRRRYDHYESMGALFRAMNADILQETLNIRLWQLFIETVSVIAIEFDTDPDEIMEKLLYKPKFRQLFSLP